MSNWEERATVFLIRSNPDSNEWWTERCYPSNFSYKANKWTKQRRGGGKCVSEGWHERCLGNKWYFLFLFLLSDTLHILKEYSSKIKLHFDLSSINLEIPIYNPFQDKHDRNFITKIALYLLIWLGCSLVKNRTARVQFGDPKHDVDSTIDWVTKVTSRTSISSLKKKKQKDHWEMKLCTKESFTWHLSKCF